MENSGTPWRNLKEAAHRAKRGTRFLSKAVKAGRLQAAVVGGRRELMFRDEWIDQWLDDMATPVIVNVRRRA